MALNFREWHLWLGEHLAGRYLDHHPDAWTATKIEDFKGEFGILVSASLFAYPALASAHLRFDFDWGPASIWALVGLFVFLARTRQSFYLRFLTKTKLVHLVTRTGTTS